MVPFKLDSDEKIIRIVRKSLILFFLDIFVFVFIAILPIVLLKVLPNYIDIQISESSLDVVRFVVCVWILFVWISLFIKFTNYYLDAWVITNKRLVDIDQKSLFSRTIATLNIDRIQDVRIEVFGILRTVLGIGTIHVETAGESQLFVIKDASHPESVKNTIMNVYHETLSLPKKVFIENDSVKQ